LVHFLLLNQRKREKGQVPLKKEWGGKNPTIRKSRRIDAVQERKKLAKGGKTKKKKTMKNVLRGGNRVKSWKRYGKLGTSVSPKDGVRASVRGATPALREE